MAQEWMGAWAGGRVARDRAGRAVFVIEKMVQGRRFRIPLEARNALEAGAELSRGATCVA